MVEKLSNKAKRLRGNRELLEVGSDHETPAIFLFTGTNSRNHSDSISMSVLTVKPQSRKEGLANWLKQSGIFLSEDSTCNTGRRAVVNGACFTV